MSGLERSFPFVPAETLTHKIAAESTRLRHEVGAGELSHFRRPVERPFLAHERDRVTILFGGLTWKHEELIRAVFQGNVYRCERLPNAEVADFQTGKEFSNNGQGNPTYFTVGKWGLSKGYVEPIIEPIASS